MPVRDDKIVNAMVQFHDVQRAVCSLDANKSKSVSSDSISGGCRITWGDPYKHRQSRAVEDDMVHLGLEGRLMGSTLRSQQLYRVRT